MRDGSLERIFRKWHVWNDDQPGLLRTPRRRDAVPAVTGSTKPLASPASRGGRERAAYLPSLVKAAGITLILSCLSMAIAVVLGVLIASGRVYGRGLVRLALTGYVELMRGTPILLQLFVIYYGLASGDQLPAFVAALVGLR